MGESAGTTRPKILVATDLSTPADEAIRQAHEWSARLGAQLVVCHIVPAHRRANMLFPQQNERDTLAAVDFESRISELVAARVTELTGRSTEAFTVTVDVGRPDAEIIRIAMNVDPDLIVVGSRGDTGLDRILLGGVSESVVRHAHCSVLVARPAPGRGSVVAATDLSDPSFPAIRVAAREASLRGAKLSVLHNVDQWPPTVSSVDPAVLGWTADAATLAAQRAQASDQLREVLERLAVQAESIITYGPPDITIVQTADNLHPELLVIGTHGRTGLARLALGSIAERVVEIASCPVLVVRLAA